MKIQVHKESKILFQPERKILNKVDLRIELKLIGPKLSIKILPSSTGPGISHDDPVRISHRDDEKVNPEPQFDGLLGIRKDKGYEPVYHV